MREICKKVYLNGHLELIMMYLPFGGIENNSFIWTAASGSLQKTSYKKHTKNHDNRAVTLRR